MLPATYLNHLLPEFQVDVWTWSCDENVRVDMVGGCQLEPLTMGAHSRGQFKRKNNLSVIARFAYMSWQQLLFNV